MLRQFPSFQSYPLSTFLNAAITSSTSLLFNPADKGEKLSVPQSIRHLENLLFFSRKFCDKTGVSEQVDNERLRRYFQQSGIQNPISAFSNLINIYQWCVKMISLFGARLWIMRSVDREVALLPAQVSSSEITPC